MTTHSSSSNTPSSPLAGDLAFRIDTAASSGQRWLGITRNSPNQTENKWYSQENEEFPSNFKGNVCLWEWALMEILNLTEFSCKHVRSPRDSSVESFRQNIERCSSQKYHRSTVVIERSIGKSLRQQLLMVFCRKKFCYKLQTESSRGKCLPAISDACVPQIENLSWAFYELKKYI